MKWIQHLWRISLSQDVDESVITPSATGYDMRRKGNVSSIYLTEPGRCKNEFLQVPLAKKTALGSHSGHS